jgi:hypothetical protein
MPNEDEGEIIVASISAHTDSKYCQIIKYYPSKRNYTYGKRGGLTWTSEKTPCSAPPGWYAGSWETMQFKFAPDQFWMPMPPLTITTEKTY